MAAATMTMREARQAYFEENGFGEDGGYGDAWVDFKLGPIPFPFPNTPMRVRAIGYHDLHHLVTEYGTDFSGELEIAAWELGAGCGAFVIPWQLNLAGAAMGAFFMPRRLLRAFVRGRRSRSFYGQDIEPLLDMSLESARQRARIDGAGDARASAVDIVAFVAAVVAGLPIAAFSFVSGLALLPFGLAAHWLRTRD
jgi:hypothetical protein